MAVALGTKWSDVELELSSGLQDRSPSVIVNAFAKCLGITPDRL